MTPPSKTSSNIIGFPTSKRTQADKLKDAKRRLQHVGILDVKVSFADDAFYRPDTEILTAVADFMEAYIINKSMSSIQDTEVKYLTEEEAKELMQATNDEDGNVA